MNPLQMPQIIDWNIARKIGMVPAASSASVTLEEWYQAVQGGWIKFPATQHPSSDPNTLDDYEEGTWTPAYTPASGSGQTVTTDGAYYLKIGKQVTCWQSFNITVLGTAAGTMTISGLPFACDASVNFGGYGREWFSSGKALGAHILAGGTSALLMCADNSTPWIASGKFTVTLSFMASA